jgi:hypothetical protein
VRLSHEGVFAIVNGRNKASKSRRYVTYRRYPSRFTAIWNTWKAVAFPQEGETLPPPPPIFGRAHEWVPLEVPGAFVAPLAPVFREWLGITPSQFENRLVEICLLDPILTGWGEDGEPLYQQAADPAMPGWWLGGGVGEWVTPPPLPEEA